MIALAPPEDDTSTDLDRAQTARREAGPDGVAGIHQAYINVTRKPQIGAAAVGFREKERPIALVLRITGNWPAPKPARAKTVRRRVDTTLTRGPTENEFSRLPSRATAV